MKSILVILLLSVCISVYCAENLQRYANVKQLQIGIKHKPTDCAKQCADGKMVSVHYQGRLIDGTEFDSSYKRNDPIQFTLGIGQVIKGWEMGLQGACVGEKRRIVIPPHLGYGSQAAGKIPPNSVLIFDVEIVDVKQE